MRTALNEKYENIVSHRTIGGSCMTNYVNEIQRRRTFAIISHPDAGKTTLTEKLLLYGGAILSAGSVKGKSEQACGQ